MKKILVLILSFTAFVLLTAGIGNTRIFDCEVKSIVKQGFVNSPDILKKLEKYELLKGGFYVIDEPSKAPKLMNKNLWKLDGKRNSKGMDKSVYTFKRENKVKNPSPATRTTKWVVTIKENDLKANVHFTIRRNPQGNFVRANGFVKADCTKKDLKQTSPSQEAVSKSASKSSTKIDEAKAIFKNMSLEDRKNIQLNLKSLGLYKSTIDGLWGKNTKYALEQYACKKQFICEDWSFATKYFKTNLLKNLAFRVQETTQRIYKKTCPESLPNCLPENKLSACHHTCGFCQNLDSETPTSKDCMTCPSGSKLKVVYNDGTGICLPDRVKEKVSSDRLNKQCFAKKTPRKSSSRVTMGFYNDLSEIVDLVWVDWDGKSRYRGTVKQGGRQGQNTFVGHRFAFISKRTGDCVGMIGAKLDYSNKVVKMSDYPVKITDTKLNIYDKSDRACRKIYSTNEDRSSFSFSVKNDTMETIRVKYATYINTRKSTDFSDSWTTVFRPGSLIKFHEEPQNAVHHFLTSDGYCVAFYKGNRSDANRIFYLSDLISELSLSSFSQQ